MSATIIKEELETNGIQATYKNCLNAHTHLWKEFFGEDLKQYAPLPTYVELLKERGHFTSLVENSDTFDKLCIVYREGVKAFSF